MKISNKGLSLIEMLISIMIMGILSGIAVVSYSGQKERITHNDFKLHSELFASAVKTCILTSGWTTELPGGTKTTGCKQFKPCSLPNNCNTAGKIGFTCPKDADCNIYTNSNISNKDFYYHCLYINTKKPVGGNHIQYITRVRIENPNRYQIWKSKEKPDFTTPEIPRNETCKKGKRYRSGDNRIDIQTTHEKVYSSDIENP